MVVSIGSSTYFYGLDTHTWKQPRENSPTHDVTHTLRTRTGYAHMETQLKLYLSFDTCMFFTLIV